MAGRTCGACTLEHSGKFELLDECRVCGGELITLALPAAASGVPCRAEGGEGTAGAGGSKTVYFVRHGQSEANLTGNDVPDTPLSATGIRQAVSWQAAVQEWGVQAVLVSPLQRTLQTATHMFDRMGGAEKTALRLSVCPEARERWWKHAQCRGRLLCDLESDGVLNQLPPSGRSLLEGLDAIAAPSTHWDPEGEKALPHRELGRRDVQAGLALMATLQSSRAETLAVVCHYGVIKFATGVEPNNACVVKCSLQMPVEGSAGGTAGAAGSEYTRPKVVEIIPCPSGDVTM